MRQKTNIALLIGSIVAIVPLLATSQQQNQTLVVSGRPGSLPVTLMNGTNYVELEALARLANVSLTFDGNQYTLTLPGGGGSGGQATSGGNPASTQGFTSGFLRAGIEAMSSIREWHTALATAIVNQVPLAQQWLTPYQAQAMTNLRLAQTAVVSDSDRNAMQLIVNVSQKMKQLSDKYVAKREDMKYISPDALSNDPLNQSIIACGKSLGAMAASGQFVDDGQCH
jgi:hypothetical protein